jgi:cytoskeleton protein RodZ
MKMPLVQSSENDAAMPSSPRSAGDWLRQQREARGLDLGDVAAVLRIKPGYLAALEAGRPDRLPGAAYAIGFVRAYAEHLGLDGGEVLRRFKQESTALAAKPDLVFPLPLGERSIPGGGMLLAAVILTICGYGAWYYLSGSNGSSPQRVAEVPIALLPQSLPQSLKESRRQPTAAPSIEVATAPLSSVHEPVPADTAAARPDSAGSAAAAMAMPLAEAAPKAQPDLTPATPQRAAGAADGSTRIAIRATADSWVEIREPGGSALVARLLRAGDSYHVPDQADLLMRTGNAGGLEITVDGNPVPSIGRMGMVRRNVALDPQALILGSAVRD